MNTTTPTKPAPPAGIASYPDEVGLYIACLAAYNNGRLHGAWVDLEEATTPEEIQECIDWILSTSPEPDAEEWAMHDHVGLPGILSRTEWPSLEDLATYAEALDKLKDEDDREAFCLWCDNLGELVSVDDFRSAYMGCFDSETDYVQERADEMGALDLGLSWPLNCIDWEMAWRELEHGTYSSHSASGGRVHIFTSA